MVNYIYSCIDDEDIKAVTKVVVCGYSIEEWICLGMCVGKLDHDCIDYLRHKHGYEKRHLPSYADRIKLQELESKCSGFRSFISSLDD